MIRLGKKIDAIENPKEVKELIAGLNKRLDTIEHRFDELEKMNNESTRWTITTFLLSMGLSVLFLGVGTYIGISSQSTQLIIAVTYITVGSFIVIVTRTWIDSKLKKKFQ